MKKPLFASRRKARFRHLPVWEMGVLLATLLILGLGHPSAKAQVTADFAADTLVGCGELEVNLTDLSSGPVVSWSWVISNSGGTPIGFSPLPNPSFILDVADSYTVELTVCDATGSCNTYIQTAYIQLFDPPAALWSATAMSGCPPLNVTFTDITSYPSGAFVSRFWVIEGGPLLPASANINYTFTTPGWFDVTLIVEDDNGCSAFFEDSIQVFAPPVLNPTASDYAACNPPLTTTFNPGVVGTGPFTYAWDFGDGGSSTLANPTHTYTTTGLFDVTLTVVDANGCSSTLIESGFIEVEPANVAFSASPATACTGQAVDFINSSTPSSGTWVWDFGDGSPTSPFFDPSHTYSVPGTYTVSLTGSFGSGCSGSSTLNLTVVDPPSGDFTSPDPDDCQEPATIAFTALPGAGVTGYLWSFGDGGSSTLANPSHTYTAFGNYTVQLTVFNAAGCGTTIEKIDFVRIQPLDVGFTIDPREGCAPLEVDFVDTTTAPTPIVAWAWDFGTGATASVASPTYTYPTPGCYDATLTVTSAAGCTGTRTRVDAVCAGATGTANFTVPDTSCPAVDVLVGTPDLSAVDVLVDGAFLTSIDNPGSTIIIPSVPSGFHTLSLIAIDYGCPDTFVTDIFILEPVDSFVTVVQDCATPYEVTLIINPSVADSACGWTWDMGDGSLFNDLDTVVYTYSTPGFYPINLDVDCYDLGTCGSLSAGGLYILDLQVDFSPNLDYSCSVPQPIIFNNASTDGYANDLTYAWTFGDGGSSFVRSPTRNYTMTGEMVVGLTVTDLNGCTGYHEDTVFLADVVPGFDWTAPCSPLVVSFTDTSSSVASIASWTLLYGDGTSDVFAGPGSPGTWLHTYPTEGDFDATMVVVDQFGCTDSITVTVENSFRQANFSVNDSTPCVGDTVFFTNNSIGTGLTYAWDFGVPGTGDTSSLFEPSWTYSSLGTYTPSLVVTDVYGCTDSMVLGTGILADSMVVEPFSWNTVVESCNFALVEFFPNPADTAEACEYLWIFGDGGTSTERTPIYPYTLAGEYTVTLIITNCNGCSDSRSVDNAINVIGPFGGYAVSNDSICAGTEVTFIVNAARTDSIDLFVGNGDVIRLDVPLIDTLTPFILSYTYDIPGTYWPQVVLSDSNDCLTILTLDSIWVGAPPTAAFDLPIDEACEGYSFELQDLSTSDDPWTTTWTFPDSTLTTAGGSSGFHAPTTGPGTVGFSMIIETVLGCTDTVFGSLELLALPSISVNGDTSVCPGAPIELQAGGGIFYTWSPPTGLSDPSIANPMASPTTATTYTVVVDNGDCIDSAQTTVTPIDALIDWVGSDTAICAGNPALLLAELFPDLPGNLSFEWTPSADVTDPYALATSTSPSASTVFTFEASCGSLNESATVYVDVIPPPVASVSPADTTIFLGESVNLNVAVVGGSPGLTYAWNPPLALSCADCPDPAATPFGDTEYQVVVSDPNGCGDSSSVLIRIRDACNAELLDVANLISPNGDGANDLFQYRFEGIERVLGVRIFDRWGDEMFYTEDPDRYWDGTRNGAACEEGVYVYTIEVVCENGKRTVVSGNVTLLR